MKAHPERDAEIVRLAEQGKSNGQIAALVGVTRNVAAGVVHRAGVAAIDRDARSPLRNRLRVEQSKDLERRRREATPGDAGPTYAISRAAGFNAAAPSAGPCRFPMWGDVERPTFVFCNAPVDAPGRPYCEQHAAICYGGKSA